MKRFFKSNAFKIFLGAGFIASGLILYTSCYNDNFISSAISYAVTPLQQAVTRVSNSAEDLLKLKEEKEQMQNEIADLKQKLNRQRDITVDYYETKKQNAQYEKYYAFKKENPSLKFVPASVIGQSSSELFGEVTVDHGTNSEISVGDAVITDNGLIGWVCAVTANSARVKTILSPDTKIGIADTVSGDVGVISGSLPLKDENLTKMKLVRSQNNMKPGDIVVTTGTGGRYPKNIKVGEIRSIETDEYDASAYAVIEPFEDVRNIRDVFIVTSFSGKGEILISESPNT